MRVAAVPLLWLVVGGAAAAAGPTDIARVDEFIDAPRALLGRTRAELERTLGPPAEVRARAGAAVLLSWPGLAIAVSRSSYAYVDADAFPNSVEFFFRAGRVTRIEWRFWTD